MKFIRFIIVVSVVFLAAAPSSVVYAAKKVSAAKIIEQMNKGEAVDYRDVIIYGDLDLSLLTRRVNDATYTENGKTTRVYTARINQSFSFNNVVFAGKVDFFSKKSLFGENREYRVSFNEKVVFQSCRFNEKVDFELTNFDESVSFQDSIFKSRPSFIRIGVATAPNFAGVDFRRGSVFKNFQNDKTQNLSVAALDSFYQNYLKTVE